MPSPALPSLEYLLECSEKSLAELELACLNRSQQCLRAAREELEQAVAQREAAGVARWVIENRPYLLEQAKRTIEARMGQNVLPFPSGCATLSGEDFDIQDRSAYLARRRRSN